MALLLFHGFIGPAILIFDEFNGKWQKHWRSVL